MIIVFLYIYIKYRNKRGMVCYDILTTEVTSANNRGQHSRPRASTVECPGGSMCANRLQPKSTWQKNTNGCTSFWFYRESIQSREG